MNEARILLTQGKTAVIDGEDLAVASPYRWHATLAGKKWYARTYFKGKRFYLHTLLTGLKLVDHEDGDGLNNRRRNLRPATKSQNQCNVGMRANNTSGFKGVAWQASHQKWQAKINIDGKQIYLGIFEDKTDAARAYNTAATKLHGEFARLNMI